MAGKDNKEKDEQQKKQTGVGEQTGAEPAAEPAGAEPTGGIKINNTPKNNTKLQPQKIQISTEAAARMNSKIQRQKPIDSIELSLEDLTDHIKTLIGGRAYNVEYVTSSTSVLTGIAKSQEELKILGATLDSLTAGRRFGFKPQNGFATEPVFIKLLVPYSEARREKTVDEDPTAALHPVYTIMEDKLSRELAAVLPIDAKGNPAMIAGDNISRGQVEVFLDASRIFLDLMRGCCNGEKYGKGDDEYRLIITIEGETLAKETLVSIIKGKNKYLRALKLV